MSDYRSERIQVGESFVAVLFAPRPGLPWAICVTRSAGGLVWEGCATFPWEFGNEAFIRLSMLHTDTDVEDLLREFGSEVDYEDFQFVADVGI